MYTTQEIAARIESGQPLSWVRYGNGEWDLVLGRGTHTGSRSQAFNDELRAAMRETVIHHDGKVMAMQNERYLRKLRLYGDVQDWLARHAPDIDWQPADVLHRASGDGSLGPFVRSLRDPVFVGPRHLEHLPIRGEHLPIPERDCWAHIDAIETGIRRIDAGRTVCISAGPTAKVLIHRLRHEGMQLIDCGSLWDVYCGVCSRRYHHAMTHETIGRNLRA